MADSGGALVKAFRAHCTNRHAGVCLEFETSTVFFAEAAQVQSSDVDRGRSLGPVSRSEPEIHHRRRLYGRERTRRTLRALV